MSPDGSGERASTGERLPRRARIRKGAEIVELLRRGRRSRSSCFDLYCAPSAGASPRFGTIVPKHGRGAVQRNRLRRRLREIGRREVLPRLRHAGVSTDVLVRTRPEAYEAAFDLLRSELVRFTEGLCSKVSS